MVTQKNGKKTEEYDIWVVSIYFIYLLTYLFETWYVNQEGLKFPGAYLPAPVLSAYVKASASTPALPLGLIYLLLEGVHPRVSMKAKGQSHGAGPLLLPLSSKDWTQSCAVAGFTHWTFLPCFCSVLFWFCFSGPFKFINLQPKRWQSG